MKLTKQWLVKHHACNSGIQAFINQKETDSIKILKLLVRSNERINLQWANWLISRLFKTKKQSIQYAVFAARLALPIFEQEYPKDLRPRKAIEAAEAWLKNPSKKNRELCNAASAYANAASAYANAASAAYAASRAAYYAAYDAYVTADASYTAYYAATYTYLTTHDAADAADTADASSYNETLTKILKYGMTLLK